MRCSCVFLAISSSLPLSSFSSHANANTIERSENNFVFNLKEGNHFDANIEAKYGYIDNFLNQSSNEKSTTFAKLSANAFMQTHNDHQLLQLDAKLDALTFNDFDEDDHSNVALKAKYFYKLSDMQTVFVSALLTNSYEYRGTGASKGNALSLNSGDEFDDTLINTGYNYGRYDSVSKVSLLVGIKEREYKTRKQQTQSLNNEAKFAHVGLDYLLSGKTYFSVLAEFEDIDYDYATDQNRKEIAILAGVKWEASQVSQLTLMLGYESLSFDQSVFDDDDIFKWRMSYDWTPLDYFSMQFKSGRSSEQSNELARNYRVVDDYTIASVYSMNSYIKVNLNVTYRSEETNFTDITVVEDNLTFGPQLQYQISDRVKMHVGYDFTSVKSDININEYDKNSFEVGINGQF